MSDEDKHYISILVETVLESRLNVLEESTIKNKDVVKKEIVQEFINDCKMNFIGVNEMEIQSLISEVLNRMHNYNKNKDKEEGR